MKIDDPKGTCERALVMMIEVVETATAIRNLPPSIALQQLADKTDTIRRMLESVKETDRIAFDEFMPRFREVARPFAEQFAKWRAAVERFPVMVQNPEPKKITHIQNAIDRSHTLCGTYLAEGVYFIAVRRPTQEPPARDRFPELELCDECFRDKRCPSCRGSQCVAHTEVVELGGGSFTCRNGDPGCDTCPACNGSGLQ